MIDLEYVILQKPISLDVQGNLMKITSSDFSVNKYLLTKEDDYIIGEKSEATVRLYEDSLIADITNDSISLHSECILPLQGIQILPDMEKIYEISIYKNNEIIYHFIPKENNGEQGLYDTLSNKFYY